MYVLTYVVYVFKHKKQGESNILKYIILTKVKNYKLNTLKLIIKIP